MKILIVEDEIFVAMHLEEAFQDLGCSVIGIAPDTKWPGRTFAGRDRLHDGAFEVDVQTVSLPMSLLRDVVETDPRRPDRPLSFLNEKPSAADAGRWRATTRFVKDLLPRDDTANAPLITGPATRLMAATALHVFPNTAVARDTRGNDRDAHPDALRRAIAFIEANPDLDIALRDIARAAYVTPRAVQLAFRRHLDTTPTAYLRRVRLQQARQQLENAGPNDGLTVTRVAIDWGFASPSRFAAHYRAAYNESPHVTLKR